VAIPHSIIVAIRNVLDKAADRIKTQILFSIKYFPKILPFMQ
jgi:hypothetical protein